MDTCQQCGKETTPGAQLCPDCADTYFICPICNAAFEIVEGMSVGEEYFCRGCAYDNLSRCAHCGGPIHPGNDNQTFCPNCENDYFMCDNCGGIFPFDDYGEGDLCQECARPPSSEYIREYHNSPSLVFHPDKLSKLYFGVELETDGYPDQGIADAAGDLSKLSDQEELFYMTEDSSLSNGIEIISQPCTLAYHKTKFPWKEISQTAQKHGGKSHDTKTCGLHIHFSRTAFEKDYELYTLRLIYVFERFWEQFVVFSRRTPEALQHNASKYDCPLFDCSKKVKIHEIANKYYRYQAVNIHPRDTIEIRIFRGSLNVGTILASIELVDFLIYLVKRTSTVALSHLTWDELVGQVKVRKYHYLMPYLIGLNLAIGGK